jgi:hypothetical protein
MSLGDVQYDIPIQLGSFLLTVAVILNIPLNTHPLRITCDWMLFGPHSRVPEDIRYYGEIFLMVFSALAIAIFVPSITVVSIPSFPFISPRLAQACLLELKGCSRPQVFSLLGATATSFCCYVMPSLLYLRVAPQPWYHYKVGPSFSSAHPFTSHPSHSRAAVFFSQSWASMLLLVAGSASGITSTVIIIMDMVKDI